jgi:hypothetical protein
MPGQFLPADHSKGDANTLAGYMAVHDRPAAFEGSDGFSYSVEILTDTTGDDAHPIGAYLLFVRWARLGAATPEGHLESAFLAQAASEADARARIGAMPLADVKQVLEAIIVERRGGSTNRRWWDAMNADEPSPNA